MKIKIIIFLYVLLFHIFGDESQTSIIKNETFFSPSVQLNLTYRIILPASYETEKAKKYPVLYLLHGHTGNYNSWISYANLPIELATQYNCIIILPDAGNSWYVNWTGQTDGKPNQWHDMMIKDLIPHVDSSFRTIKTKSGRAIGGLSMGGFGALSIGLSNVDLFSFVFSSAGAIDFCKYIREEFVRDTVDWNSPILWSEDKKTIDVPGFSNWKERTPKGLVFNKPEDADKFDPYLLLNKADVASLPYIHIDCGSRDYHLKAAIHFSEELKKKSNSYSLFILPGAHEVPYWEQAIRHTFIVMKENFLK